MCGIVGYFNLSNNSRADLRETLALAVERLRRRGPDGQGFWINERHTAALGHARLAIVDIHSGQQPFISSDGNLSLVANGEFYGYREIRNRLIEKGYSFQTNSDCEILIPLYQEYGMSMFDHLVGEYAFILYDSSNKRILAARDRFGIKPLFYHRNVNEIIFGSEIKSLIPFGVSVEWNPDTIMNDDFFIPDASQSYFKGIYSVKPAHYMLIENGVITERPYWEFNYEQPQTIQPQHELEEELKSLLRETVLTRLHGDVPVGCYVSGGIDSSTILAYAKALYDKPVTSFTIKFMNQAYDESHLSKRVAEYNDVNYVEVEVDDHKIADNYAKAVWHNEGLIYNAQGVAKFLLSQKVRENGYKVVLTGEGADEIFAGYPFFREDMGLDLESLKENNKLVSGAFLSDGNYENLFQDVSKSLNCVPSMWKVGAKFGSRFMELYSNETRASFAARHPYNEALNRFDSFRLRKFNTLNKSLYLWSKTKLPQVILSFLGDRMEMANSVEGRLPFLDHRMVEFAQKLPTDLKINKVVEKYLLREAAKDKIPDFIYNRQKFPFTAPPIINSREEGRSRLHQMTFDLLHSSYNAQVPFYDPKKVEQLMDSLMDSPLHERAGADPIINRVLSAGILAHEFGLAA